MAIAKLNSPARGVVNLPAGLTGTVLIDASQGNVFNLVATANLTLNFINVRPGESIDLYWTQGAGGPFTLTYGAAAGTQTVTGVTTGTAPVPPAVAAHIGKLTYQCTTADLTALIGTESGT